MQLSLFDTHEEASKPAAPSPPAEPWLVAELVTLGVSRETAEGYSMRQAFGIRAKLARAGGTKAKRAKDPANDDAPQVHRDGPVEKPTFALSPLEREAVAESLEAVVADYAKEQASEDEVYRVVRASLFALSSSELVRVAKGLILVLKGARS